MKLLKCFYVDIERDRDGCRPESNRSSIKSKHFFETITIEKSIISDRLASFLEATDTLKSEQIYRQTFANQIMLWKIATNNKGSIWEACEALIFRVLLGEIKEINMCTV